MAKSDGLKEKEDLTVTKLKNAFKLIKEERYAAARHVLREIEHHPKAQQMIAYLDGRVEKRKAKPAISKQTIFVVVGVIFLLAGVIFAGWAIPTYLGKFSLADLALVGSGAMDTEDLVFTRAFSYCYYKTNFQGDCERWATNASTHWIERTEVCFLENTGMVMNDAEIQRITACLQRNRVRLPS